MNYYAVIVAGGSGKRMNSNIPKQFLLLNNKPILMHTIAKFEKLCKEIIVVLPENQIVYWESLCKEFAFNVKHTIIKGGDERFFSVKNGLQAIQADEGIVAIHDGVRPCVAHQLLKDSFDNAKNNSSAVTYVRLKDSVRQLNGSSNKAVSRNDFVLIQTPQTFELKSIRAAYQQQFSTSFTDDATVFEAAGNTVNLIEGSYKNIKITTEEDLAIAEIYLQNSN